MKKVWFLWFGWNPEKAENWLEEMEAKGWNLVKINTLGLRFQFKQGESRKVRYCADYQANVEHQYTKLFEDDGWELVWNDAGWYIWKKYYTEERPSIYTDLTSLVERNNRLALVLAPIIMLLVPVFALLVLTNRGGGVFGFLFWLYICVFALYGMTFLQIRRFNNKIKKDKIRE